MSKVMISLVGEQPAPNVLPLRYFVPGQVALVHTDRTQKFASRIAKVTGGKIVQPFCKTEAYHVDLIRAELHAYIEKHHWSGSNLIFNLTGGTKTMEFAALEVARELRAQAFYYQTENNQSLIHPYRFNGYDLVCETPIPFEANLKLDEFLRLYIEHYEMGGFQDDFERKVAEVMRELGPNYETLFNLRLTGVGPNVEIDWVVRFGNTFAVGEIKLHATKKAGIDQLNGVTDQRTLGTYTKKFLISADELHPNDFELAQAYRIKVIILPSGRKEKLSDDDVEVLIKAIKVEMEPKN
jgi:hypothetical protein